MAAEGVGPNRNNETIFSQRSSLLNHELTGIPQCFDILLFCGFDRYKVNAWATGCFADCQRIVCIVLLASDKRFHMLGKDMSYAISYKTECSPPEMKG